MWICTKPCIPNQNSHRFHAYYSGYHLAFFAAATAILAKIEIKGIDSNLATAIRTAVILVLAWGIVFFKNDHHGIASLTRQNWTLLILSGLATGLSWIFYFSALQLGKVSQVAPVDKASVAIAILMDAKEAADRLSRVNRGLLLLAKLNNNMFEDSKLIDLYQILRANINLMEDLFEQRNLKIHLDIKPHQLFASPYLMEILILNLLSDLRIHADNNTEYPSYQIKTKCCSAITLRLWHFL